jgi:hypothetical protein
MLLVHHRTPYRPDPTPKAANQTCTPTEHTDRHTSFGGSTGGGEREEEEEEEEERTVRVSQGGCGEAVGDLARAQPGAGR